MAFWYGLELFGGLGAARAPPGARAWVGKHATLKPGQVSPPMIRVNVRFFGKAIFDHNFAVPGSLSEQTPLKKPIADPLNRIYFEFSRPSSYQHTPTSTLPKVQQNATLSWSTPTLTLQVGHSEEGLPAWFVKLSKPLMGALLNSWLTQHAATHLEMHYPGCVLHLLGCSHAMLDNGHRSLESVQGQGYSHIRRQK